MISVSSAASSLLNSDQIAKANQSQPANQQTEERREVSSEESRESGFTDVTNFSSEGLALAQQVNSSSQVTEQEQAESAENEQAADASPAYQALDIRA